MSTKDLLTTYTAIRFSTGKKAPGVAGPLLKAGAIIVYLFAAVPVHLGLALRKRALAAATAPKPAPPRPTTANGYPRNFHDHIDDLQEDMK